MFAWIHSLFGYVAGKVAAKESESSHMLFGVTGMLPVLEIISVQSTFARHYLFFISL
jgi:hypothetical protein